MSDPKVLIVKNHSDNNAAKVSEWLGDSLTTVEVDPARGGELPGTLSGYSGLVVMGGPQNVHPNPESAPESPWFPSLVKLIREAVDMELPYLGICLGAQLLGYAAGGTVEYCPSGPQYGSALVDLTAEAVYDPVFSGLSSSVNVIEWHNSEVTELPPNSVRLATDGHTVNQAFRVGKTAYGVQYHFEYSAMMAESRVGVYGENLTSKGFSPNKIFVGMVKTLPGLERDWRPFVSRFGAICAGFVAQDA